MEEELREGNSYYGGYTYGPCYEQKGLDQVHDQSTLAKLERSINKEASKLAKAYLRNSMPNEVNPSRLNEQIFLVFKFINTPHDVLVSGLRSM